MAVTRLERKGRKNKNVAKNRVNRIKRLNYIPAINKVDVEQIKTEFANSSNTEDQKPVAEAKQEETKTEEAKQETEVTAEVADKENTEDQVV